MLADSSPGVDARPSRSGKMEASEAAVAEDAKAALPPFEPFSPAEVESGDDARLKIRLARLQSEARKRLAESHAKRELRLEIADKQIKL